MHSVQRQLAKIWRLDGRQNEQQITMPVGKWPLLQVQRVKPVKLNMELLAPSRSREPLAEHHHTGALVVISLQVELRLSVLHKASQMVIDMYNAEACSCARFFPLKLKTAARKEGTQSKKVAKTSRSPTVRVHAGGVHGWVPRLLQDSEKSSTSALKSRSRPAAAGLPEGLLPVSRSHPLSL